MTEDKHNHLILIDGYGFVFRAYHSLPPLTRPDGVPIGAVYGFANMLLKLISENKGAKIAVILDSGSKTFRNDIYKEYKANRPPPPPDLVPQFPLIREVSLAFNLPTFDKQGFEADDIIATMVSRASVDGSKVTIVSSDKDLMQLVSDNVSMYDSMKSKHITANEVHEKFGVYPNRVLDLLSLTGDSSDNIPGVPSIGPKTAAELINEFGDLDAILESIPKIKQNKRREMLALHKEDALLSRTLVRLNDNVPLDVEVSDLPIFQIDSLKLFDFLKHQGFGSLITRAAKIFAVDHAHEDAPADKGQKKEVVFVEIKTIADFEQWIQKFSEIENLALYHSFDKKKNIELLGCSVNGQEASVVLIPDSSTASDLFSSSSSYTLDNILICLKNILEDSSVIKILYDAKELIKRANKLNIQINSFDDIMLMFYSISAGLSACSFEIIATKYLSNDFDNNEISPNAIANAAVSFFSIYKRLKNEIYLSSAYSVYYRLDKPLIKVLAMVENEGIKLDPFVLRNLSTEFEKEILTLEKEITSLAGKQFNIGSPKQLGEILFVDLAIKGGKKSKTGSYSTDSEILEDLASQGYQIADLVMKWRQFSKLKSTYTDSLLKQIAKDGRVHTNYSMAVAATGRLSSIDPNLQNIPIRTVEGNKIRSAFVAKPGYKLISADYSQVELRLLAHVAGIKPLIEAFKAGKDIHSATASDMFSVPYDEVDSELRRKAKTINFGIIYGISAFGLARRLGIDRKEAAKFIDHYFAQYPGIKQYMEECKEFARQHGYVETIWKRKCFIKGINDKNHAIRQFSERAAINAPLQGTAADIIKKAMIKLDSSLRNNNIDAKILLQVHDELVVEAREDVLEMTANLTRTAMETVVELSLPITATVSVGDNWQEIH